MSNIEMHESNAILAIDSLDRYILAGGITTTGTLGVQWLVTTPFSVIVFAGVPQNGAILTFAGGGAPGWPVVVPPNVVTITSVSGAAPNFVITISAPVTANSGPSAFLFQTFTLDAAVNAAQPRTNALVGNFNRDAPNCNDFIISSPSALIYGYIERIILSQIQLQYNIPTVCVGRNDIFHIQFISPSSISGFGEFTIPYGFYTPSEMAAMLTARAANPLEGFPAVSLSVTYTVLNGFTFTSGTAYKLFVPEPGVFVTVGYSQDKINNILKTYKMLGLTKLNGPSNPVSNTPTQQTSTHYPTFLYTPYIDFYSDVLTNYQDVKDTNTSVAKPKGLIARVYLSGSSGVQTQTGSGGLGSEPFVMTADLNNPKVIQWTPDIAVPSIDFQLRDCYGDLIPGVTEKFPTEFQMTLLCVEKKR
jgi:hypothetical protein